MIWIVMFVVIALTGGVVGFVATDKNEDRVYLAIGNAIRGGYVLLQVFLVVAWLAFFYVIGSWLFG